MTEIYLVRHVQAMGNVRRVFQGHTDEPPSHLGEEQMKCLTEFFRDIPLDAAYHSPLMRTRATCAACVGERDIPMTAEPDLIEIFAGEFENVAWDDLFRDYPEEMSHWGPDYQNFDPPGGESFRAVYERARNTVTRLAKKSEGKSILLASHGGFIRAFLTYVAYGDVEMMSEDPWVQNAGVTKLIYENGAFRIEWRNNRDFLPEELQN